MPGVTAPSLDLNREQQLQNSFFCSYLTFKIELRYKTHIDWHNSVTTHTRSVRLFPLGPVTVSVSDQKMGLFPSASGNIPVSQSPSGRGE